MSNPSPTNKLRVFLSHAVDDKPKVRKISQRLKKDGFEPWLDEEQILPGHSREYEIERALHSCDVILLCFSTNSVDREGHIQREYQQAMDIQKEKPKGAIFVIPVRLDKCDMPHFISSLQWVDYPTNYDRLLQSLRIKGGSNPSRGDMKSNSPKKEKKKADPKHRVTASRAGEFSYRQEVLDPLFRFVRNSESFYVVGAASMGKTRLLEFLSRSEVQRYYLGDKADEYWLVRVDLNRLAVRDEAWALYELLLSSILFALSNHANLENLRAEITKIDAEILQRRDNLLALRFFELAVYRLCQVYDIKLCLLLDEFDNVYRTLPAEIFLQLRAMRDANSHHVAFALFLRQLPEILRSPVDNEAFYELLSRNAIGLGPYSRTDALRIFKQIEARRGITFTREQREFLLEASGGHAGLIQGLLSAFVEKTPDLRALDQLGRIEMLSRHPAVFEECRKIFEGLTEAEQSGLCAFGKGEFASIPPAIEKLLFLKGLLKRENGAPGFFCQVFEKYVKSLSS